MASTGKNLLLLDLGLALAFPTIIIPVLRGLQKDRYPNETIYMSAEAASWYGKWFLNTKHKKKIQIKFPNYFLIIRKCCLYCEANRKCPVWLGGRADWPEESHDTCESATHCGLDDTLLCKVDGGSVHGCHPARSWNRLYGGTSCYLCRRNMVTLSENFFKLYTDY